MIQMSSLVKKDILHKLEKLLINLLVNILKDLGSIDNAHVHTSQASMMKEG